MKTIIKIIFTIVLLCAGWYLSTWLNKPKVVQTKTAIAKIKEKEIQTEAAQIKKEVDQNGLQHTIYKMVKEIDESAVDAVKADLMDTIEALGIARDKIKQVTIVAASLTIEKQQLQRKVNQMATTYSHFDNHFRLSVNVPNDTLESATFDAGYDADLITTQYNKKRLLFLNDPYIDIYSNDPRFTIKGARTLTIKPKFATFGLSADAVAGYNEYSGMSSGAGVSLRLGKVTLKGSYQYYLDHQKWAGDYGVKFRLMGQD